MVGCCIMVRAFELDIYFDCLPQRNLTINLIDLKEQIKFWAINKFLPMSKIKAVVLKFNVIITKSFSGSSGWFLISISLACYRFVHKEC